MNFNAFFSESFFNMAVQLVTTTILFLLLKSYYRLRVEQQKTAIEIEIGIIVSFHRINKAFLRDYKDVKPLKLPTETNEQFWWRTPDGLYVQYLLEEYKELKELLSINFKKKTTEEIEAALKKYYTDDFIETYIS